MRHGLISSTFNSLILAGDRISDLASWPSPSCKFPDWLDGVTWRDLAGHSRLAVDGDVMTSWMTSRSRGGRRRPQTVVAEYRCLAVWSQADSSSSASAEQTIILGLAHHNWLVFSTQVRSGVARIKDQTWNWVIRSLGHLGHLSRPGHSPGHWVIILIRCETRVFFGFLKNAQNAKRTFEMLK